MKTISPSSEFPADRLVDLISSSGDSLRKDLVREGAILFRGFGVRTASDFEKAIQTFSPDLAGTYYGTSPRTRVGKGKVFTASEVPDFFPMLPHCEMSFLKKNPKMISFFCEIEPSEGGQTPICDFRKVHDQMDPAIRDEFKRRGVKTIRNYKPHRDSSSDPFELKSWKEMFGEVSKEQVEAVCREEEMVAKWGTEPGKEDHLELVTVSDAFRVHSQAGTIAWHNHSQVFHDLAVPLEYTQIVRHKPALRSIVVLALAWTLFSVGRLRALGLNPKSVSRPMDARYGDGAVIPDSVIRHIHDLIWKNMLIFDWKQGDVLILDNQTMAHGRLPFWGPRSILVAWA